MPANLVTMRPGVRVRWWLGWHPRYAVAGGAVAGVLVGNVLVTWLVRAAMLRGGLAGVAGPLRQVVGGGGPFLFVLAVVPVALSALVGVVLGAAAWVVCARTVTRHAAAALAAALPGPASGPGGTDEFTVGDVVDGHTPPLVAAPRAYERSRVHVGPSAVTVTSHRFSLPDRTVETVRDLSVPRAAVQGVTHDAAAATLTVDLGGRTVTIAAADRPDALLAAL